MLEKIIPVLVGFILTQAIAVTWSIIKLYFGYNNLKKEFEDYRTSNNEELELIRFEHKEQMEKMDKAHKEQMFRMETEHREQMHKMDKAHTQHLLKIEQENKEHARETKKEYEALRDKLEEVAKAVFKLSGNVDLLFLGKIKTGIPDSRRS